MNNPFKKRRLFLGVCYACWGLVIAFVGLAIVFGLMYGCWAYHIVLLGCSDTERSNTNDQFFFGAPDVPRANTWFTEQERDLQDIFVGIAISGGGSRSAVFSAAVLQELNNYGFLDHITAISGVSGGALPAAYYALFGNKPEWNWEEFQARMATDYFALWWRRHLSPLNLIRYFAGRYSRSDMLADVFNDVLFHGATFGHLQGNFPHLLISATNATRIGEKFTFTYETFRNRLNSRIDTYPIAHAVATSGAFPGVFNSVTLREYDPSLADISETSTDAQYKYHHLFDGGPVDNLAIESLLEAARRFYGADPEQHFEQPPKRPARACFLFIIDAHPAPPPPQESKILEIREFSDYFFDRNALDATDAFLDRFRKNFIKRLQGGSTLQLAYGGECAVWHIKFERLGDSAQYSSDEESFTDLDPGAADRLWLLVSHIRTHYRLEIPGGCNPAKLQTALRLAAGVLIHDDRVALERALSWFEAHQLRIRRSSPSNRPVVSEFLNSMDSVFDGDRFSCIDKPARKVG